MDRVDLFWNSPFTSSYYFYLSRYAISLGMKFNGAALFDGAQRELREYYTRLAELNKVPKLVPVESRLIKAHLGI